MPDPQPIRSEKSETPSTQRRDLPPTGRQLLRLPVLISALAGVATCVVAGVVQGVPGLIGAGLAAVITLGFFALTLLLIDWTARMAPEMVMAVALGAYATKIGLLMVLLVALFEATWLSGMAFAAGVIVCTVVWLPAQVWAFRRARLSVFG